jgi:hypothetical protein
MKDREVARFTLTVERATDGTMRFAGEAAGFNQTWESASTMTFEPLSATLQLQRANGETYSMRIRYNARRVRGTTATASGQPGDATARSNRVERTVSDTVPAGTVDQRIDWAAVMSSQLKLGQIFDFSVYDPATGVSPVDVRVAAAEHTSVPAGSYETIRATYRIKKATGSESYQVLVSRTVPRMLVREEFPSGMITELVEISDAVGVTRPGR